MPRRCSWRGRWAACLLLIAAAGCGGEPRERLMLGTTHTLQDSGLLEMLEAHADTALPYDVSAVVAGSGEVLAMARNGDLDVLLTHSPEDEQAFMASGAGEARHAVMYNEFVIAGPALDPAGVAAAAGAADAFRRIEHAAAPFISRGDDSGTHRRERALWSHAQTVPGWPGYLEAGAGMADALRLAAQRNAYVLVDRATWTQLASSLPALRLLFEDDAQLRNPYSVIIVADATNADGARAFAAWLRSAPVQRLIEQFGTDARGRPLFHADTVGVR